MNNKLIIAIDGPAGAGKSTVAKALAEKLNLTYLDTGAMYRAVAWLAMSKGIDGSDLSSIKTVLQSAEISFGPGFPPTVLVNKHDVSGEIRSAAVSQLASQLSTIPLVRQDLVKLQKEIVAHGNVVLEGRDTTTVIAPDAPLKIYLTASLEERSKRRALEFSQRNVDIEFGKIRKEIEERDHRDITRDESPLTVASDAIVIDSANFSIDEVVSKIESLAEKYLEGPHRTL